MQKMSAPALRQTRPGTSSRRSRGRTSADAHPRIHPAAVGGRSDRVVGPGEVGTPRGARHGHGTPRHLALMSGTVTRRRPRVRVPLGVSLGRRSDVTAGVDTSKAALLVLIGADADGQQTVLAVTSGQRESTERWAAVPRDVKRRGLRAAHLTIADGPLGIWSGLAAVYPASAEPRCWNHKLRTVLDTVST